MNKPHPLNSQLALFEASPSRTVAPFRSQLLKWVGNKQRFAHEIISYFPKTFRTYVEPFLGSGGVLGTLAPERAVASDCFVPLIDIWQTLQSDPGKLVAWYEARWNRMAQGDKHAEYERVKASYNANPNAADLLYLSRSCYGGVVRFRKDGFMSTPCGIHSPISPISFAKRVKEWARRTAGTRFLASDYEQVMRLAKEGDLIYCDPPYSHSQAILYGAQDFSFEHLLEVVAECKSRGVFVVLSIDGTKKSGRELCDISTIKGLFEREVFVDVGRSMLKRFQMEGRSLEGHLVSDRLLLTY